MKERDAKELQKQLIRSALAVDVVRDLSRILGAEGIDIMPLKGVLLQRTVYAANPLERPISDVDVLVREEDFERAERLLRANGYRYGFPDIPVPDTGCLLLAPNGMHLDLHKHLFPFGMFNMPTHEVFARSAPDSRLFGVPIRRMAELDVLAHLIGHFVKSRFTARDTRHLGDLRVISNTMDAREAAAHFTKCGVQNAAAYVLALSSAQEVESASGARQSSRRGALLCLVARAGRRVPWEHALEPSAYKAARSTILHGANAVKRVFQRACVRSSRRAARTLGATSTTAWFVSRTIGVEAAH